MFQGLCKTIITSGIRSGHIQEDKKDECLYGMNMLFDICINIISMIIIGIITGRLWECITFCAVYKIIRKYTGGFHFDSSWGCYISSCIMYFVFAAAVAYIPFRIYEVSAMVIISSIIIWSISPVEAINKPLDKTEKRVFKKRARISICVVLVAYIICLFINTEIASVIAYGIMFVMFFAIAGKIKHMVYAEKGIK